MKARYATSHQFRQRFKGRISPHERLVADFLLSVEAFFQEPATVGDHALAAPMRELRAFWINDDYRVIYQVHDDEVLFVNIGTHAQVYQR
jgi:addiction module RelE/StbE family toxin